MLLQIVPIDQHGRLGAPYNIAGMSIGCSDYAASYEKYMCVFSTKESADLAERVLSLFCFAPGRFVRHTDSGVDKPTYYITFKGVSGLHNKFLFKIMRYFRFGAKTRDLFFNSLFKIIEAQIPYYNALLLAHYATSKPDKKNPYHIPGYSNSMDIVILDNLNTNFLFDSEKEFKGEFNNRRWGGYPVNYIYAPSNYRYNIRVESSYASPTPRLGTSRAILQKLVDNAHYKIAESLLLGRKLSKEDKIILEECCNRKNTGRKSGLVYVCKSEDYRTLTFGRRYRDVRDIATPNHLLRIANDVGFIVNARVENFELVN